MTTALDAYITGLHSYRTDRVLHICPGCGGRRRVPMEYETGGWFYLNEDAWCSVCQIEMEIVS